MGLRDIFVIGEIPVNQVAVVVFMTHTFIISKRQISKMKCRAESKIRITKIENVLEE